MTEAPALGTTRPRCPTCGEPHERDQEYCLECGGRLALAPPHTKESPLWAWAAVVSLAMVAIISGVIIALLASSDDSEIAQVADLPPASQLAPTEPPAPAPTPAPIEDPVTVPLEGPDGEPPPPEPSAPSDAPPLNADDVLPDPDTGLPQPAGPIPSGIPDPAEPLDPSEVAPAEPPAPSSSGGPADWPGGTDGFTVILASIPESRGRGQAESRAARAEAAGLDEVGVLLSSQFGSLRAGYWVTFTGVHGSLNAARAELPSARAAGFPTAYTRRVSR